MRPGRGVARPTSARGALLADPPLQGPTHVRTCGAWLPTTAGLALFRAAPAIFCAPLYNAANIFRAIGVPHIRRAWQPARPWSGVCLRGTVRGASVGPGAGRPRELPTGGAFEGGLHREPGAVTPSALQWRRSGILSRELPRRAPAGCSCGVPATAREAPGLNAARVAAAEVLR